MVSEMQLNCITFRLEWIQSEPGKRRLVVESLAVKDENIPAGNSGKDGNAMLARN
jgi:hypothetical protein